MGETDERTPLHWAVMKGDLKEVNERIAMGDDVNQADENGWTPLITAASAGFAQIADALLQAGAKANLETKEKRNAFFYAVSKCHTQVIDLFLQNGIVSWKKDIVGSTPIHRAICNPKCSIELLQMLKENDAPFDYTDNEGNLPIHLACYENRKDLVNWLETNTDCSTKSQKNSDGKYPFEMYPSNEFNA
ncbi:26S proteasome non-ATPase regulatory subunit 10 [Histomonas meleagridis]|uniref:26S proteasome non-ATPase regulatory subunit 10 n=1 Tax=Histomonas meleagridis TaxID=135588 RepID=UPI00355A9F08|nr:26S proteasome non-ATPase regulatory subunit 10 [Histomonas meleagridis]KAH0801627.1 26S proteasome non-ATPase regulatory subunit 10 [Histomonas meleagridis]